MSNDFYIGFFPPNGPMAAYVESNLSLEDAVAMIYHPYDILSRKSKLVKDTLVVAMRDIEDQTSQGVAWSLLGNNRKSTTYMGLLQSIQSINMRIETEGSMETETSEYPAFCWYQMIENVKRLETIFYLSKFRNMPLTGFLDDMIPAMKHILRTLPGRDENAAEPQAHRALREALSCYRNKKYTDKLQNLKYDLDEYIDSDKMSNKFYYEVHAARQAVGAIDGVVTNTAYQLEDQLRQFCRDYDDCTPNDKSLDRQKFFHRFVTHDAILIP